jgi:hypothetical protein
VTTLTEWINRVKYFARRARFDRELDAEVEFHIETRAAELQEACPYRKLDLASKRLLITFG